MTSRLTSLPKSCESSPRVIGGKYAIAVSTRFSVRDSGCRRGPPIARWICVGELLAGAQMPAGGDEGAAAQLGADVLDDQVEIALRTDDAGEDLA